MLKIGEFASLSSISISMLRHYDKMDMLCPIYVDESNGYRYYGIEQLVIANQIVSMKSMGLGLEEIKRALSMNRIELDVLLRNSLENKKAEVKRLNQQIDTLTRTMQLEEREEEYAFSVTLKTMPQMNVVSYCDTITEFHEEGRLWNTLQSECERYAINVGSHAVAMARHPMICGPDNQINAEVLLATDEIKSERKEYGKLKIDTIPQCQVASIVFQGKYAKIGNINIFVANWLEANHYEICDRAFTIYHHSPKECMLEEEFITELCFPVCKKEVDSLIM